jgi:hypothetical protein
LKDPLARVLSAAAWFSACGLPLERSDLGEARAYLDALGAPALVRIEPVASWDQAERIIRDPAWDTTWWDREEAERKALLARCLRRLGPSQALEDLGIKAGIEHEVIHGAAALAASRAGIADPALTRVAAGAASMAAHGRALVRLAEAGDSHLFMRKYALFDGGRWPLGIVRGSFHLF